ncbi:hypothetical protein DPMN_110587 [Dreissena polymorpha]|uniref:CCHC-type domain-containing protein n=1 Tax=Dreissena polymorpha TaxID=45954 RepID=A0A9D4KD93_DREPO|nr:hypothetical protein DPMN_110587 [Dreissena polymorpha]
MVDMLNKRLSQFMGTAETSQPRYGSRPSVMERRCYTCGSKFHLKRKYPDNGRKSRDEEKTTSGKPSVFDANVTLRERLSLKPLKVTDATVFDSHDSPSVHAECCCSSSKQIKKLGMVVERLGQSLDKQMWKFGSTSPAYRHKRNDKEKDRRCYLCGSQKHLKRQCPNNRRRKQGQKVTTSTKPGELQRDIVHTVGGIRVLSGSHMLPNLDTSTQEKRIRRESLIQRTLQEGGSKDNNTRKMQKPPWSQPAHETADAGSASVKYDAGIKKKTAVFLGDLKGHQSTVIPKTKTTVLSPADVQNRHSSGVLKEVILKQDDKRCLMSVPTCSATTPVTSGLPGKARGRASGEKELIVKVQAATIADLQKRNIVITDEGYTVFARETSCNSVTGERSACLGEICGGTASLGDIIIGYDNGEFVFSIQYEPC